MAYAQLDGSTMVLNVDGSMAETSMLAETAGNMTHSQCSSFGSASYVAHEEDVSSTQLVPTTSTARPATAATFTLQTAVTPTAIPACSQPAPATRRVALSWYRHPGIRQNRKLVIGSLLFLISGLISLVAGCVIEANPTFEAATLDGVILIVVGSLLLLPGVYFVAYIVLAARGRPGYSFLQLQNAADS